MPPIILNDTDNRRDGGSAGDTILGRGGDDTLRGQSGDDSLLGGDDEDRLEGGSQDDTLLGQDGEDRLIGDSGDDLLDGGADDDSLEGGSNDDTLLGQDGEDRLIGDSGDDLLDGDADDDSLEGGSNDDTLLGGAGDDVLDGGEGINLLDGGDDDDRLVGGNNAESLLGGRGDDTIFSDGGSDYIVPGAGDDVVKDLENHGTVYIDGSGGGDDTVFIDDEIKPWWTTSGSGTVFAGGAQRPYDDVIQGGGYDIRFHNFNGTVQFRNGSLQVTCFAAGTMILTAAGERPVETLRAGDLVVTLMGGAGLAPVRWLGRRGVDLRTHPRGAAVAPILVLPGALGAGVPHRPLRVSPEHALLVDGVLVPAGLLVDGRTILRTPPRGRVTYFHVELERHDVLLAEGAPAESYLEMGNRQNFENGGLIVALHADFAPAEGCFREGCAPRIGEGPALDRLRAGLAARRAMAAPARVSPAA
ncbi:Hint domain-containing protein [Roseomonas sp. PWR1]|uniref:Hint domain-containing protein n=1 Tax=Roseomonas nitratireducens TaxID=2820810 RepID=A0ABS4AUW5_9PROT|nr:Hint domain-containing protein [Neoroseomonas nitratireducens]